MALREVLAKFGFEIDSKELDKAKEKSDAFADRLKEIGGLFAFSQVKGFLGGLIDAGDSLGDTADKLNISAQALQRWRFAAQLAGASADVLDTAVKFLQKNVGDAANGATASAKAFTDLGVEIKDANGSLKPNAVLLREVGLKIAGLKDPAAQASAAMSIFGKAGADMVPLFRGGAEGLDEFLGKIDEFGGGFGDDALELLGKAGDETDHFGMAVTSLKSRFVVGLFPTLNRAMGWLSRTLVVFGKATDGTNLWKSAIIVLGAVAAKFAISTYAKFLPIIAVIAALILVVDDLKTFLEGGDSLLGRFLDKVFGKGAGASIAASIRDDFKKLMTDLDKIPSIGGKVEEVFSRVGGAVVKFFVDDIPEAWRFFWKDMLRSANLGGDGFFDFITGWLHRIYAEFSSWAKDASDALIDGIVDGLKDGTIKIGKAFKDFAQAGLDKLRNLFQWHSPSGVTRELMAKGLPDGLTKGLPEGQRKIQRAMGAAFAKPLEALDRPFVPSVGVQGARSLSLAQTSTNALHFHGPARAEDVRRGMSQALSDDRDAMLAALETVGG